MSSSSSSKNKRQEEKYVQMIRELASLPMNKQCFDCNSKGPTYVDVTVGSFVCTTCSGLLRGLNPPHRVKSINMSTFTQDEVDFLRNHGNQLNKMIYLNLYDANAGFSPDPKDTDRFKEFLSQKYERKRWYAEPTETMRQKIKSELEAALEKTNHSKSTSSSSSLTHSYSINNSTIRSPPEPASNVHSNAIRTNRAAPPVASVPQPAPILFFDAPAPTTSTAPSSTSLFDDFIQSSTNNNNLFSNEPFGPTATNSNDANWGAFIEPAKPSKTSPIIPTTDNISPTKPMSFSTSTSSHPPPEPADKYAAFSELFSSQTTINDSQSSIFGSTTNGGGHHSSVPSTNQNSIFGTSPFSSSTTSGSAVSSSVVNAKPPTQSSNNLFANAPFHSSSNPFVQNQFNTNSTNLFSMPPSSQPNPFLNIAQHQSHPQTTSNQFGKPQSNSTNPFL